MDHPPAALLMPENPPPGAPAAVVDFRAARGVVHLAARQAECARLLAGRAWPLATRRCRGTLRLREAAPASARRALALPLRWQGEAGEIVLDEAAQCWLLGEDVPPETPAALRRILLADELDAQVRDWLGAPPAWGHAATVPVTEALWCTLRDEAGAEVGTAGWRLARAAGWEALAARLAGTAAAPDADARAAAVLDAWRALGDCPVPLRLELGRTRLPLADLRRVAPGDIVAVDEWRPRGAALGVQVYVGRRGECQWPAEVRQNRLVILDPQEVPMPTADSTAPAAATPARPPAPAPVAARRTPEESLPVRHLAQLEVTLHFDLGALAIDLQSLGRLGPGAVIELPQPVHQAEVSISCHGRLVGQGQLVAVGERLGVRVAQFAVGDDAAPA